MEAALVGVATGVMKPLLSKLGRLLQENRAKHKNLERDTRFLRDEMSSMSATLQDLADKEELPRETKIWRDDVRELSYDIEDCVDDFVAHGAYKPDGPRGGLIQNICGKFTGLIPKIREKWKKRGPCNNSVSEIEQLKTRLIEALFPVDELMGIHDPKEHVIQLLAKFQVVSVVGPGGLGKTTLANQVYSAMKSKFSCAAFVSVSRKPNMNALLRDLAKRVGITQTAPSDDVRQLIEILRSHLNDKSMRRHACCWCR